MRRLAPVYLSDTGIGKYSEIFQCRSKGGSHTIPYCHDMPTSSQGYSGQQDRLLRPCELLQYVSYLIVYSHVPNT